MITCAPLERLGDVPELYLVPDMNNTPREVHADVDVDDAHPAARARRHVVERAASGDRGAQRQLYEAHLQRVTRRASLLTANAADAEDLVHDVFVKAFTNISRLREPDRFTTWLDAILTRTAISRIRRRARARRLGLAPDPHVDPATLGARSRSTTLNLELEQIRDSLLELPAQAGVALLLHRIEGLTYAQIAERLGVSVPTVRRRVARAAQMIERRYT